MDGGLWWAWADRFLLFLWLQGLSVTRLFHLLVLTWHCHLQQVLSLEESPTLRKDNLSENQDWNFSFFCLNSKCCFRRKTGQYHPPERTQCLRDDCERQPQPEPHQTSLERPENGRPLADLSPLHPSRVSGDLKKNIRTSPKFRKSSTFAEKTCELFYC